MAKKHEALESQPPLIDIGEKNLSDEQVVSPVMVYTWQPDGSISGADASWYARFDIDPTRTQIANPLNNIHPDDLETVQTSLQRITVDAPFQSCEHRIILSSGELKWVTRYDVGLFNDNSLTQVTTLIHDATELHNLRAQVAILESQGAAHQYSDETLVHVLQAMFHDLKRPMTRTVQLVSLLADHIELEDRDTILASIGTEAKSSAGYLTDLSVWMQKLIEHGRLEPEWSDASELVGSTVADFKPEAADNLVTVDIALDYNRLVYVDEMAVRLVLRNLLTNALKYTPQGGTIRMSVARDNDSIHFSVTDTGPGIPAEQVTSLFNAHKRTSTVGLHGEKGQGFGLLLSAWIAQKIGGTLSVDSQEGQGTTFTLAIPYHDMVDPMNEH